mgnify:CR=1 FL=1
MPPTWFLALLGVTLSFLLAIVGAATAWGRAAERVSSVHGRIDIVEGQSNETVRKVVRVETRVDGFQMNFDRLEKNNDKIDDRMRRMEDKLDRVVQAVVRVNSRSTSTAEADVES